MTITSFLSDRKEGTWNRTLLAGVHFREIMLSSVISHSLPILGIFIISLAFVGNTYGTQNYQSYLIYLLLLFVQGICAIFLGIFLSTLCPNLMVANITMLAGAVTIGIISGVFYPIDKICKAFQIASKILPITLPANAVKDIMAKGYGFGNQSVQLGFLSAFVWMILAVITGLFLLKRNRFSQNT